MFYVKQIFQVHEFIYYYCVLPKKIMFLNIFRKCRFNRDTYLRQFSTHAQFRARSNLPATNSEFIHSFSQLVHINF